MIHRQNSIVLAAALAACCAFNAHAADYALSPDGSAVVRLTPQGTVSAGTLNAASLPAGWTATTGAGGAASISSYQAGFQGGLGGGEITALFNRGSAPPAGSKLEWVQTVTTNAPLGGSTSPYLDNAANTSVPFYSLTAANVTPGLPAGQIDFYDYSKRNPGLLSTTNPITWDAKLYPVVADAATGLTVYDGVSWGWNMKKATVGNVAGTFTNPGPASASVSGVGTSNFAWGIGSPSSLSFAAAAFDTTPGTPFKLGTLTYYNGTIFGNSGASNVDFNAALSFDNIAEKNFTLSSTFSLVNTPNTSDPVASADQVSMGSWGYTFNVLEGATASVDVMATLTTGLSGATSGVETGAALRSQSGFDGSPNYTLTIVGLVNATDGGFVTSVPEPSTYALMLGGLVLVGRRVARRSSAKTH
jgi:hypothetical protein